MRESIKRWMEGVIYLFWPQLHLCDPGGVHHGSGPAQVLYQALPLGRQAHKAAALGVKWCVDTVLKVLWRWYFRPLLFLLAKHPQVHKSGSLPASKCPCREMYSAFNKLRPTLHTAHSEVTAIFTFEYKQISSDPVIKQMWPLTDHSPLLSIF